jgi:myo-inositol 2-dehydrogenase/D-chiro-inositol 1-dehydrogenase
MSIGIGVIGAGLMGGSHVRTIASEVSGADVVAVSDFDSARADEAAREAGGANVHRDPHELIRDPDVDAILVASPAETHEELVLACLAVRKPVFCEKPLATTAEASLRVVEAEVDLGRRLVRLGFMRRYDPGYADMKAALDSGALGEPLALHCVHRNPTVPSTFTSEMHTTEALIHEIDLARWLLGEEIVSTMMYAARATSHSPAGVSDPQFAILETDRGVLIDVEVFVNARYGYDIRCEAVCETGTVSLAPPATVRLRRAGEDSAPVAEDFRSRFAAAYRLEIDAWVQELQGAEPSGASAWDGYAAAAVADACLRSLAAEANSDVRRERRPELYVAGRATERTPAFANTLDTGGMS